MSRGAEWLSLPIIFGSLALALVVTEARSEPFAKLPAATERKVVDAACKFVNSDDTDSSVRLAKCIFIYDDGTEGTYWQPVTIKDGVIAVLEEE